jgi:hypothetical protein
LGEILSDLVRHNKKQTASNTMPIGQSTDESTRTGVYHVKESGLEYQHLRNLPIPKDGKEYLKRFR